MMKYSDLKKQVIRQTLQSEIFKIRQKWGIVRHIKADDFSEEKLREMSDFLQKEKAFFQDKKNTPQQYLQALKDWNAQLESIMRKRRAQALHNREDKIRTEEKADDILQELNQV